jgi:hypothetical protein
VVAEGFVLRIAGGELPGRRETTGKYCSAWGPPVVPT